MPETHARNVRKWYASVSMLALGIVSMQTPATEFFNANLSFETRDQSMWATGDAFIFDYKNEFLSPSLSTGSIAIDPSSINGGGITVDPRFAFSATAQMGVAIGFYVNSGSVNANLDYGVSIGTASPVKTGNFFRFDGSSILKSSSMLVSKSPTIETYFDGIIRMSVNDFYEAKVSGGTLFNGVTNGTFTSQRDASHGGPRISVDERKELFGFNSAGRGRLIWKGSDLGGVGDVIKVGNPLAPAAVFTIGDWRIDAAGGVDSGSVKARGQTTLLTTLIDVDAALVGPILGPSIDTSLGPNVHLSAGYDAVDFDVTLAAGYEQRFDLATTMSVTLHFNRNILVKDANLNVMETDTVSAASIDELPEIALIGTSVEVTPVFTTDAKLHNKSDISFDLMLQYKALAGHIALDFSSPFYTDDIYSASFGPLRSWESRIDPMELGVYDETFSLGGFNSVVGSTFTVSAVPEPSALLLYGPGLVCVLALVKTRRKRGTGRSRFWIDHRVAHHPAKR